MAYDICALFNVIQSKLSEDPHINLDKLSGAICVGKRTIQTVIILTTGESFRTLQNRRVLQEFRALVKCNPLYTVKELAFALGYKSPRSFARAIKRASGRTPTELRSYLHEITRLDIVGRDHKSVEV